MSPDTASVGLTLALKGAELFFQFLAGFAHLTCQVLPGCG